MSLPDVLTVARAASVPFVILLYAWNFQDHNYWATALFAAAMATDWFDGRIARSRGYSSPLGSLLDPAADKILVLAVLVMLVDQGVAPGWMVALIVVREFLVTALRLAALERGVVLHARDLGKLKTWSQAVAAGVGGFAAAGDFVLEPAREVMRREALAHAGDRIPIVRAELGTAAGLIGAGLVAFDAVG